MKLYNNSVREKEKEMSVFRRFLSTWGKRYPDTELSSGKCRDSIYKSRWPPCLALFSRGQHLSSPSPDEYFAYRTLQPRFSRKYRSRSAESCFFFAIRPLVFLPVPLISGFLWEGVRNRILMRRFSLCIPFDYHERANEAVLQVVGGKLQSFETSGFNNRLCQ